MSDYYEEHSKIMKCIADPRRLEIIDILSKGEKCACDILEHFKFTQPTLSHHMKVLMCCGLVECEKRGIWTYYKLNLNSTNKLILFLLKLTTNESEPAVSVCEQID
ncbi:MAG: ArsR/SmtB family transcription factor [Sarcina sp.]